MDRSRQLAAACACVFGFVFQSTDAALVGRLPLTQGGTDYQAVYDTDLDITWLADANLATTHTFGVTDITPNGQMYSWKAPEWINAMNAFDGGNGYLGYNDWRLPVTLQSDPTCSSYPTEGNAGFDCRGSEMGHLYYGELKVTANNSVYTGSGPELALFGGTIQGGFYWSDPPGFDDYRVGFGFVNGFQGTIEPHNPANTLYVWAVRNGDVAASDPAAVPLPQALYLFGSSVLGLIAIPRRKTA